MTEKGNAEKLKDINSGMLPIKALRRSFFSRSNEWLVPALVATKDTI